MLVGVGSGVFVSAGVLVGSGTSVSVGVGMNRVAVGMIRVGVLV